VAVALGDAIHGAVAPEDVRWEPSGGAAADYVLGRRAIFLGGDAKGAPRDVFRARVRLTPEGRPLDVSGVHDLTSTPLGDDHALVVDGAHAAFATFAYGQEQSVSALDLAGEAARATTAGDRAMTFLTNVQETGAGGGVGRIDVTLDPPAKRVGLALAGVELRIDRLDDDGISRGAIDLARGDVLRGGPGLRAEAVRHLPKRFVFWAVDTARAIPWIGPAPIAWLEDKVFALRDAAKQAAFKMHGADATETLAAAPKDDRAVLDTSKASADAASWPPPPMPSIWSKPEAGEGVWQAPKMPWIKRIAPSAPPPFYRTFVRPDAERPYATVLLVAMDTRQLDLQMEAGTEDPKPLTGGHGPGRLPRDPEVASRVVAAWNGAFKTEHGNYGMMVKRRVLLPPQPGAATVVVLADGRAGFGTWGPGAAIGGLRGIADQDIVSFRQNLDPLIDRGEINPTKRALWGYTLPGNGTQTERSGVCATASGHVVYAWGQDVSATIIARAMKMAGCEYGMHLDMNPHHTGFIFTAIDDIKARKYRSELLTSEMEISPDRYIEYAPKDFFYMILRDPAPPPLAGEGFAPRADAKTAAAWEPSPGAQPAPTWLAGVWRAKAGDVELVDVEPSRAGFRVRAGATEPDAKTGTSPITELAKDDAERALFAVGLGVASEKHPRGLATAGRMVMPVRGAAGSAVLVASADGALSIARADEADATAPLGANVDVCELPLLFDGAEARREPPASGRAPRAALGIAPGGRVVIARGTVDRDAALADALRAAGCTRAVLLDRGVRASDTFDRAGTASAPRVRYDESVLYAVARPMKPRAFRFDAAAPATAQAVP